MDTPSKYPCKETYIIDKKPSEKTPINAGSKIMKLCEKIEKQTAKTSFSLSLILPPNN